jgi:methylmalonyl-CoA/ethylmalonyl-CoA epimerase
MFAQNRRRLACLNAPGNNQLEQTMFKGLDHIAILVEDTEEALKVYRDRMGLPLLFSEVVNDGAFRLTHLDLGNAHLQLVQPLDPDHPLFAHLREHGPGLHHFCMKVENVGEAMSEAAANGIEFAQTAPHQAPNGRRAAFLAKTSTGGVQVEITGD